MKRILIALLAFSSIAFAAPSANYARVLESSGAVLAVATEHYAALNAVLVCTPPSFVFASADPDDFTAEDRLLKLEHFTPVQSVAVGDLQFVLLDWDHARGIGFAGWTMLPDDRGAFWTVRCLLEPQGLP